MLTSRRYTPVMHAKADNKLAPAPTTDRPACDHASSSPRLPTTSASTPSSLTPSRQSVCILSRGSHQPAPASGPVVLAALPPDGSADSACLLDRANSPQCVHPGQTPAQSPGSDIRRPEESRL